MQNRSLLRKFIRHPSDIPLTVSLEWVDDDVNDHPCGSLNNVSLGGLAFKSQQALLKDQEVKVNFPLISSQHNLAGKVIWNKKVSDGYEIGLKFKSPDELFRLRMIEQICHIEHYKDEVMQQQNRQLTSEQAAKEWISLYAGDFPALEA